MLCDEACGRSGYSGEHVSDHEQRVYSSGVVCSSSNTSSEPRHFIEVLLRLLLLLPASPTRVAAPAEKTANA